MHLDTACEQIQSAGHCSRVETYQDYNAVVLMSQVNSPGQSDLLEVNRHAAHGRRTMSLSLANLPSARAPVELRVAVMMIPQLRLSYLRALACCLLASTAPRRSSWPDKRLQSLPAKSFDDSLLVPIIVAAERQNLDCCEALLTCGSTGAQRGV